MIKINLLRKKKLFKHIKDAVDYIQHLWDDHCISEVYESPHWYQTAKDEFLVDKLQKFGYSKEEIDNNNVGLS